MTTQTIRWVRHFPLRVYSRIVYIPFTTVDGVVEQDWLDAMGRYIRVAWKDGTTTVFSSRNRPGLNELVTP